MPSYNLSYTYDPVGNRTSMTNNLTGEVTTYTHDAANQLIRSVDWSGVTTFIYDGCGNREVIIEPSGARTTNTWDDENRNTRIQYPDGSLVTFVYNAFGKLVRKET